MREFIKGGLAIVALLIAGSMSGAGAADMALKAPLAAPTPEYDWSGFYLGVSYGGEWQHHSWAYDPPVGGAANQSWTADSSSQTFGGLLGLQKQWGHIVVGVETNFNTDIFNQAWDSHICPTTSENCRTRANDILTVGGRVGYAGHGSPIFQDWLLYVSGGWARGTVETGVDFHGSPTGEVTSNRQGGWFAGGGAEAVLQKGPFFDLIGGVDYRHVDLGTTFQCVTGGPGGPQCGNVSVLNRDVGATAEILTVRLTLKSKPW